MSETRLNAYRIMWLFVFFDLPTNTKTERRHAAQLLGQERTGEAGYAAAVGIFLKKQYFRSLKYRKIHQTHFDGVSAFVFPIGKIGITH